MAQFYDQDNPHASYTRNSTASEIYRAEERRVSGDVEERYNRQAQSLVRNSTSRDVQRDRARVIKAQQRRQERKRRLAALAAACMIAGGVFVAGVGEVVETFQENVIVYEQMSEFRQEAIYPNTHRTMDNQHYWYDYAKIAKELEEDGKDFSSRLYMAYSYMGEFQVNRVMEYTDYANVEAYVKAKGFEDIDAWKKSEREKLILQGEINERTSELDAMHRELNGSDVLGAVPESYVGGK